MALDPFDHNMFTGRFVLVEDYDIVGGGLINMDGYADQRRQAIKSTNIFLVEHRVPIEERWKANGHRGGILWMTGLSGAGKSTSRSRSSSTYSERAISSTCSTATTSVMALLRPGLLAAGSVENIRRVGQAAELFAGAGFLVLTAFISPTGPTGTECGRSRRKSSTRSTSTPT